MKSRTRFLWTASLILPVMLVLLPILVSVHSGSKHEKKTQQQASVILLESSEGPINQGSLAKAIAFSPSDVEVLYALDRSTEDIIVHETQRKSSKRLRSSVRAQRVESLTVGSEGNIYLADSGSSQVRVISPAGESLEPVPVARPYALGVLGNGNLVVASSVGRGLLRLHGPRGSRLGSFGQMKSFDLKNDGQNRFLNKGTIAIGPSDTIYYVSRFAPTPTIQRYSGDGELLSEFLVEGAAIDFQLKAADDFLREKQSKCIGGVHIITAATVDPSTGHLWIGMNGTSKTSIVYEYDAKGTKLREYAFVLNGSSPYTGVITGVKDLVVRNKLIYLLAWEGQVYRFSIDNSVSVAKQSGKNQTLSRLLGPRLSSFFAPPSVSPTNPLEALQLPCPSTQPLNCVTNCDPGVTPSSQDCGAEVASRKADGDIIIGGSCSVGTGNCDATGNFCNTTTGVRGSISVSLVCPDPTPTPPPEGGSMCNPECTGEYFCIENLCSNCTPIVIDVLGNGFDLTDAAGGVNFDLNADGVANKLAWTSQNSDDVWLALDRNGNGTIDNGAELFGDIAPQPASSDPNGFLALAEFDKPQNGGNSDGRIDQRDAVYSSLKLWQDTNHNGISEPGELQALISRDVRGLDLDFRFSRKVDEYGNQYKYRSKVYDRRGASVGRWAWDVLLVTAP